MFVTNSTFWNSLIIHVAIHVWNIAYCADEKSQPQIFTWNLFFKQYVIAVWIFSIYGTLFIEYGQYMGIFTYQRTVHTSHYEQHAQHRTRLLIVSSPYKEFFIFTLGYTLLHGEDTLINSWLGTTFSRQPFLPIVEYNIVLTVGRMESRHLMVPFVLFYTVRHLKLGHLTIFW